MARKVRIHLTIEDTALYPVLLNSDNEDVKATAKLYMEEMGHIKEVFNTYMNKWPTGFKIIENPDDFIKETQELFKTLSKRIGQEDNILYVLVDEI